MYLCGGMRFMYYYAHEYASKPLLFQYNYKFLIIQSVESAFIVIVVIL